MFKALIKELKRYNNLITDISDMEEYESKKTDNN